MQSLEIHLMLAVQYHCSCLRRCETAASPCHKQFHHILVIHFASSVCPLSQAVHVIFLQMDHSLMMVKLVNGGVIIERWYLLTPAQDRDQRQILWPWQISRTVFWTCRLASFSSWQGQRPVWKVALDSSRSLPTQAWGMRATWLCVQCNYWCKIQLSLEKRNRSYFFF